MTKYRLLEPHEWHRLREVLEDGFIPHPDASFAAIAEDDSGKITGCLMLQLVLHMEPLVLSSPKVSFERLHDVLYSAVEKDKGLRIYCFSDKEIVDRMAAHVGMKLMPYRIFEKEVL